MDFATQFLNTVSDTNALIIYSEAIATASNIATSAVKTATSIATYAVNTATAITVQCFFLKYMCCSCC